MNKAFRISSGEIIVYLNADDEFAPDAFKRVLKAFEENPESDMIVGDLLFQDIESSVSECHPRDTKIFYNIGKTCFQIIL
ncbi:Glycosyl transferase family 2 [compost metagenome]